MSKSLSYLQTVDKSSLKTSSEGNIASKNKQMGPRKDSFFISNPRSYRETLSSGSPAKFSAEENIAIDHEMNKETIPKKDSFYISRELPGCARSNSQTVNGGTACKQDMLETDENKTEQDAWCK